MLLGVSLNSIHQILGRTALAGEFHHPFADESYDGEAIGLPIRPSHGFSTSLVKRSNKRAASTGSLPSR